LDSGDDASIVRGLIGFAKARAGNGGYESACHCLEHALNLKTDPGKTAMAEIHQLLGSIHKETYHHNAALPMLSKAAVEIRRLMYEDEEVDAIWLARLGKVYQDLGEIYAYRRQADMAEQAFKQALRWYQSSDDENHVAQVYCQLAGVYEESEQPEEAIQHYEQALKRDEAMGNTQSMAASLANIAYLQMELGQWKESTSNFRHSLQLDQQSGNLEGQLNTLDALISIYLHRQAWSRAENEAQQGLALAVRENSGYWQANFYMKLGQIHEAQRDWRQALQQFHLALDRGAQELSSQSISWITHKIAETQAALVQ
jgi:tetratricopeptide (TPR) repeat protein